MRPASFSQPADLRKQRQANDLRILAGRLRAFVLPFAVALLTLAVSITGAVLTGTTSGRATQEVEIFSSSTSGLLGDVSDLFPLGFAFAAGMVSAANPCGFTMLPAYLGLYLGSSESDSRRRGSLGQLGRGLLVGGAVTAGFVILFATIGLAFGFGAQSVVTSFPWIGLSIGVLLVLAGAWLVHGGTLYSALGERLAARMGDPTRAGIKGYFLFGLSYGTASLSCTLPIFLTVVGGTVAVSEILPSAGQFILYALGMGSVIMALTISMAIFKAALVGRVAKIVPYIQPLSAVLLLVAGGYIVYYWLTFGELLESFT
ncbi:MAG TPA: cytochrome c biogenesis protein CcdA [Dehalococcoidia bacterium]|nr:cytochrome c biogenesis protein CcdA [Dehalococcoidia bacterium]